MAATASRPGATSDPATFEEKWVKGLVEWWNIELKDRTPEWAAEITDIPARTITGRVAREFGSTRPAMAIFERGAHAHTNGMFNGMAIHTLNALVGSLFAEGGMMYQMGPSYGPMPVNAATTWTTGQETVPGSSSPDRPQGPRGRLSPGQQHDAGGGPQSPGGEPYKLDTMMFYLHQPDLDGAQRPGLGGGAEGRLHHRDLALPERDRDVCRRGPARPHLSRALPGCADLPVRGLSLDAVAGAGDRAALRHQVLRRHADRDRQADERADGRVLPQGLEGRERAPPPGGKGFAANPGDNGVVDFESWVEKGVWYKKPYIYWQVSGASSSSGTARPTPPMRRGRGQGEAAPHPVGQVRVPLRLARGQCRLDPPRPAAIRRS
jgi:thiosulfate reductase / polysulfide reductase chain A